MSTQTKKIANFKKGLSIIWKYALEYKSHIITITILSVLAAVFSGSVPFISGKFFDALISIVSGGEIIFGMPAWFVWLSLFAIFQISMNIMHFLESKKKSLFFEYLFSDYQSKASNNLLYKPFSFHKDKKLGGNMDVLARGRQALTNILGEDLSAILPMAFEGMIGLFFCFYINWVLAMIIILGSLVYVNIVWDKLPELERLKKQENSAWRKAFEDAYEAIFNIFEIKKNTSEKFEERKTRTNFFNKGFGIAKKVVNLWSNNSFSQDIIITVTRIMVFFVSVFFIMNGAITIGELMAINGYAGMVFGPFIRISSSWLRIFSGAISIVRAEKLLNIKPEDYEPEGAEKNIEINGALEFRNASFYYDKKDGNVLNNITFKVKPGETVAFVGESGVGKSTMVDLIGGFYFAQKGQILVDGIDIRKIRLNDLRKNMAYVSQEITLFNDTIENNIKYGTFDATEEEILDASKKSHCHEFIVKFPKGYKQLVGERGVKLSVGQKQRISIARAILRNPKILVLDEPTSALDSQTEQLILGSLEDLMKGRTTFIIAHRLSTVRNVDHIFLFDKGRIVEHGKHDELMSIENGLYKKYYETHIGLNNHK